MVVENDPTGARQAAPPVETRRRLGCLTTWWGLATLFFLPLLVFRLANDAGGILAMWEGIIDAARASVAGEGAVRGEGALVLLVGLALAVVIVAIQSLVHALTSAALAPVVAAIQAVCLGVALRGLLDLFRMGKDYPLEDPRYLRRWRARGALAAVLFAFWVVVLVPLLSQLGSHPVPVPTAGAAASLFCWSCIVLMPSFWLLGTCVRAVKRRRASPATGQSNPGQSNPG